MSSEYITRIRSKIGNARLMITSSVAVIKNTQNHLLLQETHQQTWALPGGMIEPGESPQETVVREVLEETGLKIVPQNILGAFGGEAFRYTYPNGDQVEYTVIVFACHVLADTGQYDKAATRTLKYFSKDKLPELSLPYPKTLFFSEE